MRPGDTLRDLQATVDTLRAVGKVGIVGYCYGGTLAWISAAKLHGAACAIGYYGGGLTQQLALEPRVPVMLHFGERDHLISLSDVEKIKTALPNVPVHVYAAGHGFNCDARESYDAASATLAKQRTLELLRAQVG
jgi:carboxymethylenebutenolidase